MTAKHCIIHGKVQGVFYRDWTVETARSHDLTGWVRNLSDGTVEAHLEGDAQSVARMIEAMEHGPPRAEPTRIEAQDAEPQDHEGFERR